MVLACTDARTAILRAKVSANLSACGGGSSFFSLQRSVQCLLSATYESLVGHSSIKRLSNANYVYIRVGSGMQAGTEAVNLCPEWTPSEVADYVATYLRVAGFCALCSGLYVAVGASTHQCLYIYFRFGSPYPRFSACGATTHFSTTSSLYPNVFWNRYRLRE